MVFWTLKNIINVFPNLLATAQNLLVMEIFQYHHWIQQPRKPILGAKAVSLQGKAAHMGNLHFLDLENFGLAQMDQILGWLKWTNRILPYTIGQLTLTPLTLT